MGRIKCDVSDTLVSLDSVVAASDRTGVCPIWFDTALLQVCSCKNRSACAELLFGPGLPTERVHTRFEVKLPHYSSAAANSHFACIELLSDPGPPADRAHMPDLS